MKRIKHVLDEWGRPILVILGAVVGFFLLIRLCFPNAGPNLEHISFEKGATVYVSVSTVEGEWEDIPLSAEESEAVIKALNGCGLWTSFTCDCAGGAGLTIGEQRVRYLEDHFHYIGRDRMVNIPKWHLEKLEEILGEYVRYD